MHGTVLYEYRILFCALLAWSLAQLLKVPVYYLITRRWNWGLWFSAGGMPSSHSALVVATALSVGLFDGFDTPDFAIALALAMVVIYDAAGVRRQAGIHAQRINFIINELLARHPISEEHLKEVLGHTPRQVIAGTIIGIMIPTIVAWLWK
jgi:uncharacterized protein